MRSSSLSSSTKQCWEPVESVRTPCKIQFRIWFPSLCARPRDHNSHASTVSAPVCHCQSMKVALTWAQQRCRLWAHGTPSKHKSVVLARLWPKTISNCSSSLRKIRSLSQYLHALIIISSLKRRNKRTCRDSRNGKSSASFRIWRSNAKGRTSL